MRLSSFYGVVAIVIVLLIIIANQHGTIQKLRSDKKPKDKPKLT
jgi:tellurite resistance protein TehA-like permease